MFGSKYSENEMSVIQYDGGKETFVWKCPIQDFTMGYKLIVHE